MRTLRYTRGGQTSFILADLEPRHHQVARDLGYGLVPEGFAKTYPADTPHLERIHQNFARYAERMVRQAAREEGVPWERALLAFLELVGAHNLRWWLRGSAALAVRGLKVQPGDVDLTVHEDDVYRLNEVMLPYLIEPLVPVTGWVCGWWSRAFLHARLEWMGGVLPAADLPEPSDFGLAAERLAERVAWRGYTVLVPPLELQLRVSERRGLTARAETIKGALENRARSRPS